MIKLRAFTALALIMTSIPMNAWAHGTEEEHQQENTIYDQLLQGGLITSIVILLIAAASLYVISRKLKSLNVKSQQGQKRRNSLKKSSKVLRWIAAGAVLSSITLGFIASAGNSDDTDNTVQFHHIHGLGYKSDGDSFYVPAHDGLRMYSNGQWSIPEGGKHDYMGFSMVDDGFYSSGHPGPGSKLENPFGVVKSTDYGKSLDILDLYKEVDFHGMAAGYYSHAIYVLNPQPNSRMEDPGLFYTLDDTKTWNKSKMNGLQGQAASIAVHPTEKNIVAIGTKQGAFLSTDYGNTFEPLVGNVPTSAVHFTNQKTLLVGGLEDVPVLYEVNVETKEKNTITIPEISNEDAIAYIAQNPQKDSEFVFTTFEKQIYITNNKGNSWTRIAENGTAINVGDEQE